MKKIYSFLVLVLIFNLLSSCATQPKSTSQSAQLMTTYILVRHAEKVKGVRDPDLTSEGEERAKTLEYLLRNVKLDAIYSSDYKRTQQTALPVSKAKSIKVQSYDPRDLEGLIAEVEKKYAGKTVLIVGHSNTTPALASLLTTDKYAAFDESIYDNFFIINRFENGKGKAFLLKFN